MGTLLLIKAQMYCQEGNSSNISFAGQQLCSMCWNVGGILHWVRGREQEQQGFPYPGSELCRKNVESSRVESRSVIPELLHCLPGGLPAAPWGIFLFHPCCQAVGCARGRGMQCPERDVLGATKVGTQLANFAVAKLQLVLLLNGQGWLQPPHPSWRITGCDLAQELPSVALTILIFSHFPTRSDVPSLLPVLAKNQGLCSPGLVLGQ